MRITIIGAGSFGTTLAHTWAAEGKEVRLWAREPEVVQGIREERRNPLFNSQFTLSGRIAVTGSLPEALTGADVAVLAVPSKFMRSFMPELRGALIASQPHGNLRIISVIKGLLFEPTEQVSACAERELEGIPHAWLQLCGPNLSVEIMQGEPAASVLASHDEAAAKELQAELSTPRLRLYTNRDPKGVEACGALKNILAVASGITSGLGLGLNSRGVLLTRGIVEMRRLLPVFGGDPETLHGLAGIGDLIATSFSENSRNFRAGVEFGKGQHLKDVVGDTPMVAEGVHTVRALVAMLDEKYPQLDLPITREVHAVIYAAKPPLAAISDLMRRPYKEER
jgi:glycerol-3-phosphate dehydrogenase (NAD(P)+)